MGMKALVVDDIEMNRRIMTGQLNSIGMQAEAVADAFFAVAALERGHARGEKIDLVLLDQMMPDMSGINLAQRIRTMPWGADIKLVLVSSAMDHADADHAATARIDAVLTKPLRQQVLFECLARVFGTEAPAEPATVAPCGASRRRGRSACFWPRTTRSISRSRAPSSARRAMPSRSPITARKRSPRCARGSFEVVLMDIQMPVMDGVQATGLIRALPAAGLQHPDHRADRPCHGRRPPAISRCRAWTIIYRSR